MNKDYTKRFRKEILKTHLIVAVVSVTTLLFFYSVLDYSYNGAFIDFVERLFGLQFAQYVLRNQKLFVIITILIILVFNSIVVEIYAIRKISKVFSQMRILVQEDEQEIQLDKSLKELEYDLNALKKESVANKKMLIEEAQHKVDMIAFLAHDIKTPLASVIGYLCLLDETDELSEELRHKYTTITLEKAYRLEKLINEFFDIAKLNQVSSQLDKEDIHIYYLLEQMKEEFYPLLVEQNKQVSIQADKDLMIRVDSQKIARAFSNVLRNAVFYGYENTTIFIEVLELEAFVCVRFRNQGPTIPKEKISQIFQQFYRLDESRSSSTGGSGLGLSIAKMIVEQHQGRIKVVSENEITTFDIYIPL